MNVLNGDSFRSLYKVNLYNSNKLYIKRSSIHRWGVFAKSPIKKYELIEESPYFIVPYKNIKKIPSCFAYSYFLNNDSTIIGMGYAGLYNHSFNANIDYEIDKINEIMKHYAIMDIDSGEELTLNYGEENAKYFSNITE